MNQLADRPPQITAHGTTEMKSAYTVPTIPARLITDKDQYKHPASLPLEPVSSTRNLKPKTSIFEQLSYKSTPTDNFFSSIYTSRPTYSQSTFSLPITNVTT